MTIQNLSELLTTHAKDHGQEYTRLFHGRGNFYDNFKELTVDAVDKVLYVALFAPREDEAKLIVMLKDFFKQHTFEALVFQRRFLKGAPSELLEGTLPEKCYAVEDGLKYHINFMSNQNIGFFPDMKIGRQYVRAHAKGKKVLNLFSYTCPFSVAAIAGGARNVVNVDMAKGALTTGRENHRLNELDARSAQFMPYNILKSWARIKKAGPYEMIIIDPPSFQKGSFAATSDYEKIIKRLDQLAAPECTVLSALNAPELDTSFIKDLFKENAPEFHYVERLENLESFPADNEETSLKNLIFKRDIS